MGNASSMKTPVLSIVGLSGSGKTTLMVKLISELSKRGLRVGTIKHSRHPHALDVPGKDSWRHKDAGAEKSIFIGPDSLQLVSDVKDNPSPETLADKYLRDMDIVLVEGFLQSSTEKIEVVRSARSEKPVTTPREGLIAIATDLAAIAGPEVPCFNLNDTEGISDFIQKHFSTGISREKV